MHYLITIITEADDKDEALANAEAYANELVEQAEFDWYDMDGRWGKSEAMKLTSIKGQKRLQESMGYTRKEFDRSITAIRHMLEHYDDNAIYNEDWSNDSNKGVPHYLSRYQFVCAGGGGNTVNTYGDSSVWGGRIDNNKDLQHILERKEGTDRLYVVPIDFHN